MAGIRRASNEAAPAPAMLRQHCTRSVLCSQYVLFGGGVLAPFHPLWSLLNFGLAPFDPTGAKAVVQLASFQPTSTRRRLIDPQFCGLDGEVVMDFATALSTAIQISASDWRGGKANQQAGNAAAQACEMLRVFCTTEKIASRPLTGAETETNATTLCVAVLEGQGLGGTVCAQMYYDARNTLAAYR